MERVVADLFGFHAVQLGFDDLEGLQTNRMPHRWLGLDQPLSCRVDFVTDFRALPFTEQSLDLVLLPHTLEMHGMKAKQIGHDPLHLDLFPMQHVLPQRA